MTNRCFAKRGPAPTRSFDRIARVYRWLEYASFGRALKHTRESHLAQLQSARHALVLGDGDGRFLAALLEQNQLLHAVVIDVSGRMLELLKIRCRAAGDRLVTRRGNLAVDAPALVEAEQDQPFDLVVTHFFLDCLSQSDLEALVSSIRPRLQADAQWAVSEFRVPPRGVLHPVGRALIRSLYFSFWALTGLRVHQLPDYPAALERAGFRLQARQLRLRGLLSAELWQLVPPTLSCE